MADEYIPPAETSAEKKRYGQTNKLKEQWKTAKESIMKKIPDKQKIKDILESIIPSPGKTAVAIGLFTYILVMVKYWPQMISWLIHDYLTDIPLMGAAVMILCVIVMAQIALFAFVWFLAGKMIWTWTKAWWTGKPILLEWSVDNQFRFLIPKEIHPNGWDLNDKESVVVKRGSVGVAPHKKSLAIGIPELGTTFTAEEVMDKYDIGIDMAGVAEHGEWREQRGYKDAKKEDRDPNNFAMFLPWIIIFLVVGAIFVPLAYKAMGEFNLSTQCQTQLMQCSSVNKWQPGLNFSYTMPQPTTTPTYAQPPVQSNTGGGVQPG